MKRSVPQQELTGGDQIARTALRPFRMFFVGLLVISSLINLLHMSGSIFMLEVYDRALPSRSVATLTGLLILVLGLYAFLGLLDFIRSRILVRMGAAIDATLSERVHDAMVRLSLAGVKENPAQPGQDLDQLRTFFASGGPAGFLDLPWLPLYLGLLYLFHPWIGYAALAGAIFLVALTRITEMGTRAATLRATGLNAQRARIADSSRRNAETLTAMGMAPRLYRRWREVNSRYLGEVNKATDVSLGLGSVSKVARMALQSLILALSAYLVIKQQASAGVMIASTVLLGRALAPVETAIAHWRGFVASRLAWNRLSAALDRFDTPERMELPAPHRALTVSRLTLTPPGQQRIVVSDVSFELEAGKALAVVGLSGSGKSSMARALVGVWRPARGEVRLDGAAIDQWSPIALGEHIGYLPQGVELFEGTIAQNIARFEPDFSPQAVINAARAAEAHDMIVRLPDGYETQIGELGGNLSAGQRQWIGLARALYKDPFLVVLDEPNSNLDSEGDAALGRAIMRIRERNGVAVVIAHRPNVLQSVDFVMVMNSGTVHAYGTRDKILRVANQAPRSVASQQQDSVKSIKEGSA